MMINELNTGLIEALKEKLPPKTNLANLLMDTLYIGREAIYRRLRGEVPFTLEEAALISRKLGVSLDKIVGVSFSANAVFDLNVVDHDDPFNAYFTILSRYVKIFRAFQDDPLRLWVPLPILFLRPFILSMTFCQSFVYLSGCIRISISNAIILRI